MIIEQKEREREQMIRYEQQEGEREKNSGYMEEQNIKRQTQRNKANSKRRVRKKESDNMVYRDKTKCTSFLNTSLKYGVNTN